MEKIKIEIVRRDTDFDIKNVKLFEVTGKAEKGIKMTEDNVKSFIDNHEKFKAEK